MRSRAAPAGVLFKVDLEVLRRWVQTVDRCQKLQQILDAEYGQPEWENMPAHRSLDRAMGVLLRLAAELGFTPASRPKLRVEPVPADGCRQPVGRTAPVARRQVGRRGAVNTVAASLTQSGPFL